MLELIINNVVNVFGAINNIFSDKKQKDKFIEAMRDRLYREVKYNHEMLGLINDDATTTSTIFSKIIETQAIDELMNLPYPVEEILNNKIHKNVKKRFSDLENKNHNHWVSSIDTEVDLLERIKLRIEITKVRSQHEIGTGDISYLQLLLSGMEETLRRSNGKKSSIQNEVKMNKNGKMILYLVQNHRRDLAITIKEDCNSRFNNAWICRQHGSLDLKNKGARGNTVCIKDELDKRNAFEHRIDQHPDWKYSKGGASCCMSGTKYEGHITFGSVEKAVKFLKEHFDIRACETNKDQTQEWIDGL